LKVLLSVFEISAIVLSGNFLYNEGINYKFLIILCLLLGGTDVFTAILNRYIKKEFHKVKSKKFIIGIILKFVFLFSMLFSGILLNNLFEIDFKNGALLVYILYELKSIDENIHEITGYSLIDNIVKTILFFKNTNKDV
jgi:predicted tellurium resistance membrane protein TerC